MSKKISVIIKDPGKKPRHLYISNILDSAIFFMAFLIIPGTAENIVALVICIAVLLILVLCRKSGNKKRILLSGERETESKDINDTLNIF